MQKSSKKLAKRLSIKLAKILSIKLAKRLSIKLTKGLPQESHESITNTFPQAHRRARTILLYYMREDRKGATDKRKNAEQRSKRYTYIGIYGLQE